MEISEQLELQLIALRNSRNLQVELESIRKTIEELLKIEDGEEDDDEFDEFAVEELEGLIYKHVLDSDVPDGVGNNSLNCPELLDLLFDLSQLHYQLSDVALLIANSPFCSKELLSKLSRVDNKWDTGNSVRANVASNPTTPSDTLSYIWRSIGDFEKHSADDLIWCLARNPKTPTEILQQIGLEHISDYFVLVGDSYPNKAPVSYALAANPNTPLETLAGLIDQKSNPEDGEGSSEMINMAKQNLLARQSGLNFIPTASSPPDSNSYVLRRFEWE